MFKIKSHFSILGLLCFVLATANAETATQDDAVYQSNKIINNLKESLNMATQETKTVFYFPTKLRVKEMARNVQWAASYRNRTLVIEESANCQGARVCTIGYLNISRDEPRIYYSINEQEITDSVRLAHNLKGYFTPGHPMADYFRPRIEWRDEGLLYTIEWNVAKEQNEKGFLLELANNIIEQKYNMPMR